MNVWKRAYLSITRRKLNSLVLLLIVFILANVFLTTLAVTNSLHNTREMVLKQFPPVVSVEYEYVNEGIDEMEVPYATPELADKLYEKTQEIVKTYDYSQQLFLNMPEGIEKASLLPGMDEISKNSFQSGMENILQTIGTQLSSTSLIVKKEGSLIQGRGFSDSDLKEGKPKVIVSKQFAQTNQLSLGSMLTVQRNLYEDDGGAEQGDLFFSEDIELEVVGILEINKLEEFIKQQSIEFSADTNKCDQMQQLANQIYVPNKYASSIIKDNFQRRNQHEQKQGGDVSEDTINPMVFPEFVLKDIKDLDLFISEAKKVYDEKYFTYKSVASEYEVVAAPLNTMGNLLDSIFNITVVASIIILSLVIYIFMFLRQKEMGVLLALGEHRRRIVGQVMIETLMVAFIGATLAIITSIIFSNILTDHTIQQLLTPTKELTNGMQSLNTGYGITAESVSTQVQTGLHFMTFVMFYGIMIVTIFVSQIATTLYLLRLNPKKILM